MTFHITKTDLAFMEGAKAAFAADATLESYRDENESLIALRRGYDRDSIEVLKLDGFVAYFTQQLDPCPRPRIEVQEFAYDMEHQLRVNEHKRGWQNEHHEFLRKEIIKNFSALISSIENDDKDKHEITIRCANIANFAMMIADNEGEHL